MDGRVLVEPLGELDEPELEEPELELDELGVVVVVAALADRVVPIIAPPANPAVMRAADAHSFGLVRMSSLSDIPGTSFLSVRPVPDTVS
jgi:hypothetical protein